VGFRNAYGRMKWDNVAPTITAGCTSLSKGRFGQPEKEQQRAWLIVGLLFLFMMLNFSDKAIVGLAGVPMMKETGLTPRQSGLVGSSFLFLFSISAVIGGFVANRVQTRWLLLAMAAVWAATQLPMIGSVGLTIVIAC
jgi:MFS transporter, ACS family, D-galactonate transporter